MTVTDHDIDTLARTLYGEAVPRDHEDATAIAHVILNRVALPNWPSKIAAVCKQPYQFSCWNANDPNLGRITSVERGENDWFDQCVKLAEKVARKRETVDPTYRSTHYHTPAVTPAWSRKKTPVYETAGHMFFNDIDTPPPKTAKEALDQQHPLTESRTAKGAVGAGMGGLGVGADGATEVIDQIERGASIMSEGGWLKLALGLVIVGFAAYIFYARMNDRNEGRN